MHAPLKVNKVAFKAVHVLCLCLSVFSVFRSRDTLIKNQINISKFFASHLKFRECHAKDAKFNIRKGL